MILKNTDSMKSPINSTAFLAVSTGVLKVAFTLNPKSS